MKRLPPSYNAFRASSTENIKKNRTLLFGGKLRGDLHSYLEKPELLRREKLLFEKSLMKTSPITCGNGQNMALCLDAVVDLLDLLCGSDLCGLLVKRQQLIVKFTRE